MESLYVWWFILAGVIIALLGIFLLTSERELRKQRREVEELRRKRIVEPQRGETHSPAELMTRNKELMDKISSLSSRLEESQRAVEELQSEQRRLASLPSEDQRLREITVNLRDQLQTSETRLSASSSENQEIAERNSKLQTEIADLKEQLQLSQKYIEELRIEQPRLEGVKHENEQLQQELANLQHQLKKSESLLIASAGEYNELTERNSQLQSELAETRQQVDKLMLNTKALLEEINSLARQLAASQATVEDLRTKVSRIQLENQQLTLANRELQQELAKTKEELQTSQAHLGESARQNQEANDCYARLQTEIDDLTQQLEQSDAKGRELEGAQQQLAKVESRDLIFRNQQQQLEAEITELRRQLSAGAERVQELEAISERAAEMEQLCQELRAENRRLEEEISLWQERLAESEKAENQLSTLRRQLDELQTKQPTGSEANPPNTDLSENNSSHIHIKIKPAEEPARTHLAKEQGIKPAVRTSGNRRWRLGIVPASVVLAIGGAVAVGFLGTSPESKEPAVALGTISDEQLEFGLKTTKKPSLASATGSGDHELTRASKASARLPSTFEITRPTQVYSGPSENSALIAKIEPGTKINVVDSRNGWLEIRSKHGRPPGFVRQEVAVRVTRPDTPGEPSVKRN